jgi:hypothetical protein
LTANAPPRLAVYVSRALLAAALALMLFYFVVYVVYAVNLMNFPFDYDQGEGFELVDTLMFSRGQWPYQDVEPYPFYASNYPPVFHLMAVPFAWAFGPAYWYGRLLGFLGTLITAGAIAYAVYRDGRARVGRGHRLIAALAGLAFLASNVIYHIGPLFRQHATMVMFETLAVVILARWAHPTPPAGRGFNFPLSVYGEGGRGWGLILALGLLIVAGYTKQLAAITAIAVFAWLFVRNPRRAVISAVSFALVGGAIFAWMTWATDGQWWRQAILANVNQIRFDQVEGLFRLWFGLHGFLIVPAALMVIYELYFDRLSLYSVWFVVATALGGAASGTWGGGDSYFATSIAALCILGGIFASRTLYGGWTFYDNAYARLFARIFGRPLRRFAPALMAVGLLIVPLVYLGYGRAVLHMPTTGPVFAPLADALGLTANASNTDAAAGAGNFYDSAGRVAGGYTDIGHLTTAADIAAGWRIVEIMREAHAEAGKPPLSEEAGFNLAAGFDVVTNPTQLLNVWLRGLYDGGALIAMIEAQAFGVIVLRAQFYPEPVLLAITEFYETSEVIGMNGFDYIIKRPRSMP